MTSLRVAQLLVAPLLAASLTACLTACGGDPIDDYCTSLKDHQQELTDTLGEGGPSGLIAALPIFKDLERNAPDDIEKDWTRLTTVVGDLDAALEKAGVSADDFENGKPPEGVSQAEAKRIADAATAVSSKKTQQASVRVQQQARDVCHTSLTL
ncbi:hypothetical protein J2S40_001899 [Nocardioides luteus]|uniref:Uncharacterized protein n=1 Tax=Nocardioides luteus TaxID=1844 RepID=A0ABQ5SZX1_9ACTN|nr:hypothetical protein [Nocardioides luteus]MDR7310841.1 hypothetical protein [Nocardioides luteus]GGR40282.1 hypothetical protein GCM10010197_01550 [Nocardioides luteus]GLJ69379.1 hypothetical protein GCM10017579_34150 [Nocardioides luteus]